MHWLAERLQAIPGVVAVTLGGSRARGAEHPGSDWDFGLYYRGHLDSGHIRALGFAGTVVDTGEWGRLMNGGAWFTLDGVKVDVLYRDLDVVESWAALAEQGRFEIDPLLGHLAGFPTYALAGELALGQQLTGPPLPKPVFPIALRDTAPPAWRWRVTFHRNYAESHRVRGDERAAAALETRADIEEGHARMCERGEWVLNEKGLLARAGLPTHFSGAQFSDAQFSGSQSSGSQSSNTPPSGSLPVVRDAG
jgi:predicted nucleotidyltransferase